MSLGIGLGAFMQGFEQGQGLRQKIDDNNRREKQRADLAQIQKDAEAKFDDLMTDDAFDYMMRRQAMVYLRNGDVEKAQKLRGFADDATTRQGTKLFAGALRAYQLGDKKTGRNFLEQLLNLDGYGPKGATFELTETEHPQLKQGTVVTMTGKDGGTSQFFIPEGKEAEALAAVANPIARFEAQTAEEQQQRKRAEGLEDYERKKEIDSSHSAAGKYTRQNAVADLEKIYDGDRLSERPLFADLPAQERERLIAERMKMVQGGDGANPAAPAPAAKKVIVDTRTGERVPAGMGQNGGAGQETGPAPAGFGSAPSQRQPTAAPAAPAQATQQHRAPPTRQEMLQDAAAHMREGGNPEYIAQRLMNAGVPRNEWPDEMKPMMANPAGFGP